MSGDLAFFEKAPSGVARMAYREWGRHHERKLLCSHGLTRNSRDFEPLAQALSENYHVVAPDMAGRGASDRLSNPQNYHYGTYQTDIVALLDHLGWRTLDWVGTSMGGILGMMVAASQPGRISKLVLNDIGVRIPRAGLARIAAYAGALPDHETREAAEQQARAIGGQFGLGDAELPRFIEASLQRTWQNKWRIACDPLILEAMRVHTNDFREIEDVDLSTFWDRVACPVLLIRGERSDILTEEDAEAMARSPHHETKLVTIKGSGHAPHLMSAEQIGIVRDWLSR